MPVAKGISSLRPVYAVGGGLHPYRAASAASYVELGLTAVRAALADAGVGWADNDASFVGTATLGVAGGRAMLRHLGASTAQILHVENASASGSAAFRAACVEVGSGLAEVAVAVGVDKPNVVQHAYQMTGIPSPVGDAVALPTHFALVASEYAAANGLKAEDIARVAVKNHANGALNPFAQRRKARSLEEVLASKPVSGMLTALQCCPVGEGAAAVVVMSEAALARHATAAARAVRIAGSATFSETQSAQTSFDAVLTGLTVAAALADAGLSPRDLDVIELHDAFSVEELLYLEEIGVAARGRAAEDLKAGRFAIGGECAVSPSGGLLAMGHPTGPTGVGQIVEIMRQLRGEAGDRQQPGAKFGLAHMCGLGSVCYAHVLTRV